MNEEQPKQDKKERNRKANKILLPIVGILILVLIIIVIASSIGGGNGKKAKYQATLDISNAVVVNPATLSVTFHVKNVGNAAGSPTCTIDVSDPSGTYSGEDILTDGPTIQPGQTNTSADQITVTKQGAQYVTQGNITCN